MEQKITEGAEVLVVPAGEDTAPSAERRREPNFELAEGARIDLRKKFPPSRLFLVRKLILPLALIAGVLIVSVLLDLTIASATGLSAFGVTSFLGRLSALLLIGFTIYWELYRRKLEYFIEGYRLFISKGVLPHRKTTVPLLPITEIQVDREKRDMLLGIADLTIRTPVSGDDEYTVIECLGSETAEELQAFFAHQLDRLVSQDEEEEPIYHLPQSRSYGFRNNPE